MRFVGISMSLMLTWSESICFFTCYDLCHSTKSFSVLTYVMLFC